MQTQPEVSLREITRLEMKRMEEKMRDETPRPNPLPKFLRKDKLPGFIVMAVAGLVFVIGLTLLIMAGTMLSLYSVPPL